MILPQHPRLLFTAEGITQLAARIERATWAAARWEALRRELDEVVTAPVELPPRGGGWWHWYACPTHGAPLQRGRQLGPWQWEHICPVNGEIIPSSTSSPDRDYDACDIMGLHDQWAGRIRDLGVAYRLTGDAAYAAKAREILLDYAGRYLDYPLHTIRNEAKLGGGRVGPQTLDESVWLIPLCQGADLIWDTLSEAERQMVADKLLLPATKEVILPHQLGIHNIQCWKNSAVGLAGLLLGDEELIYEAIDQPGRGYRAQMAQGVLPDGIWWEGAWGYHFYTLLALWPLVVAGHNCGVLEFDAPFREMFLAPLRFAMPNLRLPAFNDSGVVDLRERGSSIYELAYALYGEESLLPLLHSSDRRNNFALWFGVPELPSAPPMTRVSHNYTASGYAILARGQGEQATWLCLKYGPHGGGHGHPDKLSFVLYSRGQVIAPDPGTARYGLPIQRGYYRTTLAHNTLVADETSQNPANGQPLAFGSEGGVDYVVAAAGDIYEGVRFTRAVALVDEQLLLFVDQIVADQPRLLDIAYHQRGFWAEPRRGEGWVPPDQDGYRYLRDALVHATEESVQLDLQVQDSWPTAVTLAGGEPTQVITATGVGAHMEDREPVALFRRVAQATAYAWCVALDGRRCELSWLPVTDSAGEPLPHWQAAALRVRDEHGRAWTLLVNPQQIVVRVAMPDGAAWQGNTAFAVL